MKTLFLSLLLMPSPAWAWGHLGHRVIAEIAQRHLSSEASARVGKILRGRTLADVAAWADELRDDPKYEKYNALHFATVPDGVSHYAASVKNPCGDVVVAIHALSAFLATGNRDRLAAIKAFGQTADAQCNPTPTPPLDEFAVLALLVHFVGDVHQPLHVGGTDAGGNWLKVHWMGSAESNLHTVWDSSLLGVEDLAYSEYARFLDHSTDAQREEWKRAPIEAWADESIALRPEIYRFPDVKRPSKTDAIASGPPAGEVRTLATWGFVFAIGYGYIADHRDHVRTQLTKAGIRLAHMLNEICAH